MEVTAYEKPTEEIRYPAPAGSALLKSDVQLATVFVTHNPSYSPDGGHTHENSNKRTGVVIVDGGNFILNSTTKEHGKGTRAASNGYRGAFITDYVRTIVDGGYFCARGDGKYSRRELTAFGTAALYNQKARSAETIGYCTINGGTFDSDGYAIHHFDPGQKDEDGLGILNTTRIMEFPKIVGGFFKGRIGYTGMTFADSDGNYTLHRKLAYETFNISLSTCAIDGKYQSGYPVTNPANMKLRDMHGIKELYVLDVPAFSMTCSVPFPEWDTLFRTNYDVDEYRISYSLPDWVSVSYALPCFKIFYGDEITSYSDSSLTVSYGDYTDLLEMSVRVGLEIKLPGYDSKEIGVTYHYTIGIVNKAAEILNQPQNGSAELGEFASTSVNALYALSYLWYIKFNGMWLPLNEQYLSMLTGNGTEIEGADTCTLRLKTTAVARGQFRCRLTGTDGNTVYTSAVTLTVGDSPEVHGFVGGSYEEDGNALFILSGKYFGTVTFYVDLGKTYSASERFVTLEEFKEKTGIESVQKDYNRGSILTFQNVPASVSGKYRVGYEIKNSIASTVSGGAVGFDPENTLPIVLKQIVPVIETQVSDAFCRVGENAEFSFSADQIAEAEWVFEKYDEEQEVTIAYTLDDMRSSFPDTTFSESLTAQYAVLTIENAQPDLDSYTVTGYARNSGTSISAGSGTVVFTLGESTPKEDLNEDGSVDINDVTVLLNALASGGLREELDLNDDQTVTIADVTTLLNVLSGGARSDS